MKTDERQAKEYAEANYPKRKLHEDWDAQYLDDGYYIAKEAFLAGMHTPGNEWISILDKLPDKFITVNVLLFDGRYSNSWIRDDNKWAFRLDVTHWKYI